MTDENLRRVIMSEARAWQRRIAEIRVERMALDAEKKWLTGKLDAAKVLIGEIPDADVEHVALAPQDFNEEEQGPLLGNAILDAVKELRGSPEPWQIKQWIMANRGIHITGKAAQPYFYTVLSRHARSGRLIKDGDGYCLPSDDKGL
jgi:hypothetical protein